MGKDKIIEFMLCLCFSFRKENETGYTFSRGHGQAVITVPFNSDLKHMVGIAEEIAYDKGYLDASSKYKSSLEDIIDGILK